jgi:glyoxylase-like metal-dependent hydrolase (beta-lactamase superfamily II)
MAFEPPLRVAVVPVTPFQQNASVVWCTATNEAAIVDPGGDLPRLVAAVAELGVKPAKILLTHGHIDHAGGAAELSAHYNIPVEGPHEADAFLLAGLPEKGREFGMMDARALVPDRYLAEGDEVALGDLRFAVLHVPGHSPGSVVFHHAPSQFALVGDTLFQGSVGRSDFPYGDGAQLVAGIKAKLFPLGDDTLVLPGHGGATSIGDERRTNPFLR